MNKPCPIEEFPGTCPNCGAFKADGWVKGFHGWTCGSYSQAHHTKYAEPLNIIQSTECAAQYWEERAQAAESKIIILEEHLRIYQGQRDAAIDDLHKIALIITGIAT